MPPLTVLLIGDGDRPEFAEATAALRAECDLISAANAADALARCATDDRQPGLIVLAQDRPGQFSAAAVDALRVRWPLARMQGLMGTWCEGEMRTGRPWPAVTRAYWHGWLAGWRRERERMRSGRLPSWALPVTAGDDERLLLAVEDGLPPRADRPTAIAVVAADAELAHWICDLCRTAGHQPLAISPPLARIQGVAAGIWDGRLDLPGGCEQLAEFVEAIGPAPVLALLGFPRVEDFERARAAGACGVLSKPLLGDALLAELARAIGTATPRAGTATPSPLAPLASASD